MSSALERLEVRSLRCFTEAVLEPAPEGITVLSGPNGCGKTTLLEAIGFLATQRSLRGAPKEALVRQGEPAAFLRGRFSASGRPLVVEAEVRSSGRTQVVRNGQRLSSRRALAEELAITVFSPEDLGLLQGPPSRRRQLLDDAVVQLEPPMTGAIEDFERCLRQRNALLRQVTPGKRSRFGTWSTSLDVWDQRTAQAGEAVAAARERVVRRLAGHVASTYHVLAGKEAGNISLYYERSFSGALSDALMTARLEDLARGVTTVGPHHDDLHVFLEGRHARHQASQGEQRCLALALRVGVHHLATEVRGAAPVLVLDDVLSELDEQRSAALFTAVPVGQTLLSTATTLPGGLAPAAQVDVAVLGSPLGATGTEGPSW